MEKVLIIVDVQNDFLPGGALGILGGDRALLVIQRLIPCFNHVLAAQDWHPENHISFAKTHSRKDGEEARLDGKKQHLWPIHCVQNSFGARISSSLD